MRLVYAVVVGTLLLCGRAAAYPQFQLSGDATCTGCHISPAGGGTLNENGLQVAETQSWKGTDPTFFYGTSLPAWFQVSGDVRGAAGTVDNGAVGAAAYPMQAEVHATAGTHGFTLNVTGGLRRPQDGGSPAHVVWSRQHYLMWQQNPGDAEGVYVRAGRFMPVYGLRLAEHVAYTQRFGGNVLYGEAYAGAVEYVTHRFEAHVTGFVHDPIASAFERGDGAATYLEARLGEHAALGAQAKYASDDDLTRTYVGVTGKLYIESADVLLQGEAELVHQRVATIDRTFDQIVGYVLASRPIVQAWLLDVGVGHYAQDTMVQGNYRDCVDANVHWFVTSHLEALVTTRLELLGSGPMGGFALAQLHYRL